MCDGDVVNNGAATEVDVAEAQSALIKHGFVVLNMPTGSVDEFTRTLGLIKSGWHDIYALQQHEARPNTLSAIHGYSAFPWHTDGAVAPIPPHYMVLAADDASATETQLIDVKAHVELRRVLGATVLGGRYGRRTRYLRGAHVGPSGIRFRWDSRFSSPTTTDHVENALARVPQDRICAVHWTPGRALVVDNWRMLHRRSHLAADDNGVRRLRRLYIHSQEGATA